jgi:hypothetical protein
MIGGLTFLIKHYNAREGPRLELTARQIAFMLRDGVITEPERFEDFAEVYSSYFCKNIRPDLHTDKSRPIALHELVSLALLADNIYDDKAVKRIENGIKLSDFFCSWN